MTLIGDEGRRQAYLAALGIPLWTARQPLPHALPSDGLGFVPFVAEQNSVVTEPVLEVVLEAAPAIVTPEPVALVVPKPIIETPMRAKAPEPGATPIGGKKPVEFPRFNFWFKTLPQGWRLLIALGEVPDLSAQEHMLLAQIEAVLGGEGMQAPIPFRWPLNNNPAIPRDAQAATEAVSAFLKRHHQADSRYLVLGEEILPFAQAALAAEKFASGASLARLLAEPARKRELWQSLIAHL